MNLYIDGVWKRFRSDNYNYDFNMVTGYFERWGATKDDDPTYSPFGGEILDLEVSSICSMGCPFCYKGNTPNGKHMSFETFKDIIDKLPKYNNIHFTTQCAFGIGDVDASETLWEMMQYCRDNGIIPNVTINGDRLTDEIVQKLVSLTGAISVSRYEDKNICYDAVKRLTDVGCKQVNIHAMICEETFEDTYSTLAHKITDPRLEKLNAIVLLSLKQKGRGVNHTPLSFDKFKYLVKYALHNNISIGFDSCGANIAAKVFKELGVLDKLEQYIEPCESCSFSQFIDTDGIFYPCSFASECTTGIDMTKVNNFMDEVWFAKSTCLERKKIQDNGRSCPYFTVGG
jgi:MoaA/NifB/PqqE/SkfB family radical SAM enzyme